ncbi:MAG: aspartyl-tRNA(Asn)/glutamyl-tRNA(Gln) amidotransferase subunit B [Polaribacter sp.]|jgi:aspartyl-tRNA(Asn)/glutamyl-tRNA(Gln) amidotransferase subunit B
MSDINTIYETVIGLEVHVQLATNSKAFCGDDSRFGSAPNTHISAISLAHPGTLPRLNERQVEYAVRLGLALGCSINHHNIFDRKSYFYADLPKGYQITQDQKPFCSGGSLTIKGEGFDRTIRLHHIHMEEDAGKSIHDADPKYTLIDLNRAGVPLLEIVTEPDFRSADEVATFMTKMRQLVRYLAVSDGNMEEGSLRCDVNISLRKKGTEPYGERCEVKNLNSMRFARQAIAYEVKRQAKILESGGVIKRNTLNFDSTTGTTSPLREKEDAHDYRYFPDPDLPPLQLTQEYVDNIKNSLPPLPDELKEELITTYALSEYNADLLTQEKTTADYFLSLAKETKHHKALANLLINKVIPTANEQQKDLTGLDLSSAQITEFIELIASNQISSSMAYQSLFPLLLLESGASPMALAKRENLLQESDGDFLSELVEQVLAKHPKEVAAYKGGKKQLMGFFMGQVMKSSKGKADPKKTTRLLGEALK